MTSVLTFLFTPLILFVVIVLPIWLVFHYKTKWKILNANKESPEGTVRVDQKELTELQGVASRLEKRIDALEGILDAEAPSWREK